MNRFDKFFMENSKKVRIGYAIVVVLITLCIILSFAIGMSKNDEYAYTLIEQNITDFKSPESVEIIDAILITLENEKVVVAKISAINSFGARSTDEYVIANGIIFKSETNYIDGGLLSENSEKLNVRKLNKAIDKDFGKM